MSFDLRRVFQHRADSVAGGADDLTPPPPHAAGEEAAEAAALAAYDAEMARGGSRRLAVLHALLAYRARRRGATENDVRQALARGFARRRLMARGADPRLL